MRVLAALVLSALLTSVPQSQTKKLTSPATPHAQWSDKVYDVLFLDQEQFTEAGLDKLTPHELGLIMDFVKLKSDVAALNKTTYECGPVHNTAADFDKVHLLMSFFEHTPDELKSAVLQRLRSISDLMLVYNRDDADIEVSFLGGETKNTAGGRLGYTASVITTDVCRVKMSTTKVDVDDLIHSEVLMGATIDEIASPAVASLDAGQFERVRRMNSTYRKSFLQVR